MIVVSRPVPVLAETVAVLAGASPLRWDVAALAGPAGTVLPAVFHAWTGAAAASAAGVLLVIGLVLLLAGLFPLVGSSGARRGLPPPVPPHAESGRTGSRLRSRRRERSRPWSPSPD